MGLNYIVFVIPFFLILIALELIINKIKKGSKYRLNDAVINLNIGIGEQVLSVFIKGTMLAVYAWLHQFAIFQIPSNGWTFLLLFILFDLLYYWAHRLGHEVNFMWAGHISHHTSEEYNLTVALRQPWFQTITTSFIFLPLAIIGFSVELFLAASAVDILYQFWIHTKYVPKMGKVIEFIFNTPSHHRVHHGINPKYLDKNHGGVFIIWDRMFGTFQEEDDEPVYGITTAAKSFNPIWLNLHYFVEIAEKSRQFPRWSDKIKNIFMPPGWRPKELGGREIPREVSPETYQKYEVTASKALNYYALIQFAVLVLISAAFLYYQYDLTARNLIMLTGFILLSMYNSGAMFEKKQHAYWLEFIRLLLLPCIPFMFDSILSMDSMWLIMKTLSVYSALSLVLLLSNKQQILA
jgi:sterol desaturase/sphingolipid hydroxylase (fatty acid hydroxylase superfamily)